MGQSKSAEAVRGGSDQGQQGQPQSGDQGHNPFGGLIDGAKGLFHRAEKEVKNIDQKKIGDAVGQAGRALGDGADKLGANGIGQQARDIGGSAERTIQGNGTAQDKQRLVNAGVEAGKLMVGGGTFQIAEKLAKSGLVPGGLGSLGNIFNRGAREITKLDTLGFVKGVRENWDALDTDHDGYISRDDVKKASEDPIFRFKNAHMLAVLDSMNDTLANCQNDQIGSESSGVSKGDIAAVEKGKLEGTGYGGLGATGKGAWDAKYLAGAGGLLTGYMNYGKVSTGSMLTRGGMVTAGILAAGGIYGTIDYYGSRKENIEKVISELK